MKFKIGDKVRVTKSFLLKLPNLVEQVKNGGVITKTCEDEAEVMFYSGHTYYIFFSSLELILIKNQQLLFNFME